MSIADEILRLRNAKAAIKSSLENKGVTVSDASKLDDYYLYIDNIEVGGGDSGNSYYEDLFNAKTTNKTNYSYLFADSGAKSLDLSNLDTSNVISMSFMFDGCNYLTSLDVSNFDTSKAATMQSMFRDCTHLTELDVSNFDTSKVTNMSYMFAGSQGSVEFTQIIGLENFNISKVTNMNYMFAKNWTITSLDVSFWDIGHVTSIENMFNNCKELVDLKAPQNINANLTVSSSGKLSHDSLMSIINNLATVTATKTLALGSTNLAKLTDEEKAIATNKGWTLK